MSGHDLSLVAKRLKSDTLSTIGCAVLAQQCLLAHAAVQTYDYLTLGAEPRYRQYVSMPYANPRAVQGGQIRFAVLGSFDNLNPMNGLGTGAEGVEYLYDSLMQTSLDEPGVKYPLLATHVRYDRVRPGVVEFTLNPAARFSNGLPVTSADVVATFEAILQQGAPGIRLYFGDIAKVVALGPHRVRFVFRTDQNKALPLLVAGVSIFSRADLARHSFRQITLSPPLGSGPYVLARVDAGRMLVYQRNRNYWASHLAVNRGAYNADQVIYRYYRDDAVAFTAFKKGDVDVHSESNAHRWATGYDLPAVRTGQIRRLAYVHANPLMQHSIAMNSRRAPLNDIALRQALTRAYNFEWQNRAFFDGQYRRLNSFFDNSELAATGQPSAAEWTIIKPLLPRLSPVMQQGVTRAWRYPVAPDGYNRAHLLQARQLLLAAGYSYTSNGQLLDRNKRPVQLIWVMERGGLGGSSQGSQGGSVMRQIAAYIRDLARLGITIHLKQLDTTAYYAHLERYDFDLVMSEMLQTLNPASEQLRMWSCAAARQPGNYNLAGICHPAIDEVLKLMVNAPTRSDLVTRTRVLDRLLRAGYWHILTEGRSQEWYAYRQQLQPPPRLPRLNIGWKYWSIRPQSSQPDSVAMKAQSP